MALTEFPLFCWQLDNSIVAKVLGTDIQVVEDDVKKVRQAAADAISRQVRNGDYIDAPEMQQASLHFHTIDIQLSYKEERGTFPLADPTPFKVAAVYGGINEHSFGECHLPFFDEEFYYYSKEQRSTLIKHFSREFLQNYSPEQAYRFVMPSEPWLEFVRVNTEPRQNKNRIYTREIPSILKETCDALPIAKKLRKSTTRLPEVAWERGQEISMLTQLLLENGGNTLLVGEQGVGKSSLWIEAIKQVHRQQDDENPITVWRTTSQRLTGKAKYFGEWQAICDEVVEALAQVNGVLWITDFISLFQSGGESQEDSVAAYLQSFVQKGMLRLIGEMRPQEMESARAKLPSFVHMFKSIHVEELDPQRARSVLQLLSQYARDNYSLSIHQEAVDLCFQLCQRYLTYEKKPGNFVRFFSLCLKKAVKKNNTVITREFVNQEFIHFTGLPEILLRDDLALTQESLLQFFGDRIKGQNHVLRSLCQVVQTFKAGLNDPERPIATLLFAGPTGVGKTAATKALAEFFFSAGQRNNPLFTLDMSEFQHPGQIQRLIGDSYEPGKLISHVRNQPFSVILFDEIEKAHPSVFDMLLTVLDEGMLTDRNGRVTDFRSSIIIMTSNLGIEKGQSIGFVDSSNELVSIADIQQHFRPEFFNRIDAVLPFSALDFDSIKQIVNRELALLQKRDGIRQREISLSFSENLIGFIAEVGFSPKYGARPIQRAIEKHIVAPLARFLISNTTIKTIHLDLVDGEIRFS